MARFVVWTVHTSHWQVRAFDDVSLALAASLKRLGHDVETYCGPRMPIGGRLIVLGAMLCRDRKLPDDAIIYQLEQWNSCWLEDDEVYRQILAEHALWDFSPRSVTLAREDGLRSHLCRFGYVPELVRLTPKPKDIDVLFYGALNERRQTLLLDFLRRRVDVHIVDHRAPRFGADLDRLIERAKVVVNMHHYEQAAFEIVRCAPLLANRVLVVSERGTDPTLEEPLEDGLFFERTEKLADKCAEVLALSEADVRAMQERAFEAIIRIPMEREVERALDETGATQ